MACHPMPAALDSASLLRNSKDQHLTVELQLVGVY